MVILNPEEFLVKLRMAKVTNLTNLTSLPRNLTNLTFQLFQDGEKRYAAVTFFVPADARRCFPCWDEPALKATFALRVTAPKNRTVHSNMPPVTG
jgi:aminopeptidase N